MLDIETYVKNQLVSIYLFIVRWSDWYSFISVWWIWNNNEMQAVAQYIFPKNSDSIRNVYLLHVSSKHWDSHYNWILASASKLWTNWQSMAMTNHIVVMIKTLVIFGNIWKCSPFCFTYTFFPSIPSQSGLQISHQP